MFLDLEKAYGRVLREELWIQIKRVESSRVVAENSARYVGLQCDRDGACSGNGKRVKP